MIRLFSFVALLFLSASFTSFAQQPKDWANFRKYSKANAEVTKRPDAVFMGNSITESWERMRPDFFNDNNFLCRGISGQVSSQMLVRFRTDVVDLKPKVVVIMAGTNDVALNDYAVTPENTINNIISMIEIARANKIKVVLCSIPPAAQFSWRKSVTNSAETIKNINEQLKAYAKKHKIPYADYYEALVDERGGIPKKYSNDDVHPTNKGFQVMEPIILKILKKLL